jgi:hypothetical protein
LVDALDQYAKQFAHIKQLERATARQTLNALDKVYPPTETRDALRKKILDILAWQRQELEKWLAQVFDTKGLTAD